MGRHPKPCTLADIKRALTPPANLRERADLCTTFAGGAARGTLETAGPDATRWLHTRRTDIDRLAPSIPSAYHGIAPSHALSRAAMRSSWWWTLIMRPAIC